MQWSPGGTRSKFPLIYCPPILVTREGAYERSPKLHSSDTFSNRKAMFETESGHTSTLCKTWPHGFRRKARRYMLVMAKSQGSRSSVDNKRQAGNHLQELVAAVSIIGLRHIRTSESYRDQKEDQQLMHDMSSPKALLSSKERMVTVQS